jgi:CheY-like chemotaxis protein
MPEPPPAIRVVLADDSVLFREGLARVLADNGFAVVGQAADADALHEVVGQAEPDVVVTDIRMPPTNSNDGLLAAQRIRAEHPGVGVLVLSQYVETRHAIRLLQHAPQRVGYLLKDGCPISRSSPKRCGGSPGAGRRSTPTSWRSCCGAKEKTAPWPASPGVPAGTAAPARRGGPCHRS